MPRRSSRPSLARALAYRNDDIPYKFMERWDVSFADAQELFTETKRLLWVMEYCRTRRHRFELAPPLAILDEMWHTFVLFTREYESYCKRLYGLYLHHHPTTRGDREKALRQFERDREAFAARHGKHSERQWRLIAEAAGEATLLRWYVELPLRYDPRFFRTKAIPLKMSWRPPRSLVRLVRERT